MKKAVAGRKVVITFVTRDVELNRIGISKLAQEGLHKVYILYDVRTKEDSTTPEDGWAEISVKNKDTLLGLIKPLIQDVELKPIDPNTSFDSIQTIVEKEIEKGNTVFIDATSLRRVTIAHLPILSILFGAKIYLVVQKSQDLYDPRKTYIKEDDKLIPISDWAAKQKGELELVNIPIIDIKLNKEELKIINKIKDKQFDSVKTLAHEVSLSEANLREYLRKLKEMDILSVVKLDKIKEIRLTPYGKLVLRSTQLKT